MENCQDFEVVSGVKAFNINSGELQTLSKFRQGLWMHASTCQGVHACKKPKPLKPYTLNKANCTPATETAGLSSINLGNYGFGKEMLSLKALECSGIQLTTRPNLSGWVGELSRLTLLRVFDLIFQKLQTLSNPGGTVVAYQHKPCLTSSH